MVLGFFEFLNYFSDISENRRLERPTLLEKRGCLVACALRRTATQRNKQRKFTAAHERFAEADNQW